MQHLLHDVMGDGGQWTMAMNVYKKYGAVPKDLFPETASSKNTGEMNTQLRALLHTAVAHMYANKAQIDEIIARTTDAGHRILTIHLGEPPKSFDWEWTDTDGNFHRDGEITPVDFWKKYVNAGLEDYVCLVDDPRVEHPKGRKIGIGHLGNVAGGDPQPGTIVYAGDLERGFTSERLSGIFGLQLNVTHEHNRWGAYAI